MRVPKKPQIISAPCCTSRLGAAWANQGQPSSPRPAVTPSARARKPSSRNGARCLGLVSMAWPLVSSGAGAAAGLAGQLDLPEFWPLLQVFPGHLMAEYILELMLERSGIVVVDQDQGVARVQRAEAVEDQRMALSRRDGPNVDDIVRYGWCGLATTATATHRSLLSAWCNERVWLRQIGVRLGFPPCCIRQNRPNCRRARSDILAGDQAGSQTTSMPMG